MADPDDWGEFSRIYHSIVDDPKFENVYPDDHHFATWGRLLMAADQAWPASASLPISVNRRSVAVLSDAGIIELGTHGRFRICGLDKERNRRADRARAAADARWKARNADA